MEPLAYGLLGLRPGEFAALTPREFFAMADAAVDRLNEDREFRAGLALPGIQAATNTPTTLAGLLGSEYLAWSLKRDQRRHERAARAEG